MGTNSKVVQTKMSKRLIEEKITKEVDAIKDINSRDISPPPRLSSDHENLFLTGVAKVMVLIRISKLLSEGALSLTATVQE